MAGGGGVTGLSNQGFRRDDDQDEEDPPEQPRPVFGLSEAEDRHKNKNGGIHKEQEEQDEDPGCQFLCFPLPPSVNRVFLSAPWILVFLCWASTVQVGSSPTVFPMK